MVFLKKYLAQIKLLKKVLKKYDPIKFMIYHNRGEKTRALFDRDDLPRKEQNIRNTIRRNGFWMR